MSAYNKIYIKYIGKCNQNIKNNNIIMTINTTNNNSRE